MRCRHLPVLAAALASAGTARAQRVVATVEAGAASVGYDEYARSTAAVIVPSLLLTTPRASLEGYGALSMFEGGSHSVQGGLAGRLATPERRGFAAELTGDGGTTVYNAATPITFARGELAARYRRPTLGGGWGVWAGPVAGLVAAGASRRTVTGASLGAWRQSGGATVGARVTPTAVGSLHYTDVEGWGTWTRGRLELGAAAGARRIDRGATGARAWVNGSLVAWLGRRVAVVAGVGAVPADLVQGVPGGGFGTLTLRVRSHPRPSAAGAAAMAAIARHVLATRLDSRLAAARGEREAFVVRAAGNGWFGLRVAAAAAARVELMGDFTGWEPVALDRRADGWWEIALPVAAGSHRFNVRVDGGAWTVPAGVGRVADDFGGEAGVLSIP